jgi:uncharacterized lipoprotein YajG
MRIILTASAVLLAAACGQTTEDSTPDATIQEAPAPVEPTVIILTEQDARSRIEAAGYTGITGLTQSPDGTWTATATREGATTTLSVGEGGVTVVTTP